MLVDELAKGKAMEKVLRLTPWPRIPPSSTADRHSMRSTVLALAGLLLASCASQPPSTASAVPQISPECLAAKLKPVDPLPINAIPEEVLRKAQSGWVVVSYDVVSGKARNLKVVGSNPSGLYDSYVLRHTANYTEPTGATVRGCIATTNIQF